nr:N-acetyltransferase [Acidianus infernus]
MQQIYEIEVESFDNPYPYSLLKAYLYIADGLYLVVKEDGKILGYVIGIIQFKIRGHIVSIAVRKSYRNKGIGKLLINEIERRFKLGHCKYSYLEVMTTNKDAFYFYVHNGYFPLFVRKNYYGRGKHAFVMVKDLYSRKGLE